MNKIIELFKNQKEVKKFFELSNYNDVLITSSTKNHNLLLTINHYLTHNETVIYVASNLYNATVAYEIITDLIGIENVNFYVTDEVVAVEALAISNEFKYERMHTISSLIKNNKRIIITYISSFLRPLIPIDIYKQNVLNIKMNDTINVNDFIKKLIIMGYKRVPTTTQTGEFSIRGELIDIFAINNDKPYRIGLFDDEIEYIKTYDPTTQMSITNTDNIDIFPINELLYEYNDSIIDNITKDISNDVDIDIFNDDFESLKTYINNDHVYKYIKYIYPKTETILDYVKEGSIIIDEYNEVKESYENTIEELNYFLETKPEYYGLDLCFFDNFSIVNNNSFKKIYLTNRTQTLQGVKLQNIISIDGVDVINYHNNIKNLCEDVTSLGKTILLICYKQLSLNIIVDTFNVQNKDINIIDNLNEIENKKVNIIILDNGISFAFINGIEVITEDNIFKKTKLRNSKYRSVYQNTTTINSKDELKPGDYIVHYDYGIGQYQGIVTEELRGMKNDYLNIKFSNNQLYVPVERINLIEKYLGSEGSIPKLSTIGTKEWEKKKKKIQEKVESIAKDLIDLQAQREQIKGYIYEKDNDIQIQFENDFEFEATKDQDKTIKEIKKDMESGLIIDRLVCGDVGYGKTEVAIRIAMKTVLNNKQVAYLAPTTILTRQHFQTFTNRFSQYGVKVALLNRLVPLSDQQKIIDDLKKGLIDIVIGTHSLLSDNIKFKDLGLLIIDEEQRFGVTHKEKIKQMKANVNVLTLTATPIPRTLQMSIMGVRQLSLMETPPQNRYPVQTYVLEENETIVREAIYRELGRGGQVFYLHNRVDDLDLLFNKLHRLVPNARIIKAHGKMKKEDLEDAIQSFIDKKYDVLLCTTIIETGIDIPNTNTLIVDMADRLGLAQMYQIRGRVGRSTRVSYAYFMYEKNKVLTSESNKRLQAIKEFTTLGSGYKIAVRDLAIRGAGDILGKEQSGFIDTIGLDLYMKMLNDSVNKLKGKFEVEQELKYQVRVAKHVSDKYVSDDDIRIYIHKEIKTISSLEEKQKVEQELTDRFGKLTPEIQGYINKQYMEGICKQLGIESITEKKVIIEISFSENADVDGGKLFKCAYSVNKLFTFEYKNKRIIIHLPINENWIDEMITVVENYMKK